MAGHVFHEFGHAIETQSGLRNQVQLRNLLLSTRKGTDQQKAEAENILDQMIELSEETTSSVEGVERRRGFGTAIR